MVYLFDIYLVLLGRVVGKDNVSKAPYAVAVSCTAPSRCVDTGSGECPHSHSRCSPLKYF